MRKLVTVIGCLLLWACQTESDVIVKDVRFFPKSAFSDKIPQESLLEQIKRDKKLVIVTRNSPTTYYLDNKERPTGIEYDLAKKFADSLGVELEIITASSFSDMVPLLALGKAHIAAAGLLASPQRAEIVRFGPAYQFVSNTVVYRIGSKRPRNLSELHQGMLEVVAGSSQEDRLHEILHDYPELKWATSYHSSSEDLLSMVWSKVIDFTIVESHELAMNNRNYPELRAAFNVSAPSPLAWAFPPSLDKSLYVAAQKYFNKIKQDGTLHELLERYYGHTDEFDYVGAVKFIEHSRQRLPRYRQWFENAADKVGLDWHLLAAIGYQESHWDAKAVSPTGVKGLMMLTRRTARAMAVKDRVDPKQSIFGGAKLFRTILKSLPRTIQRQDRMWMALAAYNVGYGHLMDARYITEQRGGNPDKWFDVRENLPLLSQKQYYTQTRYGYARGHEPVTYVENIRRYYDTLTWMSERKDENRPLALAQVMQ